MRIHPLPRPGLAERRRIPRPNRLPLRSGSSRHPHLHRTSTTTPQTGQNPEHEPPDPHHEAAPHHDPEQDRGSEPEINPTTMRSHHTQRRDNIQHTTSHLDRTPRRRQSTQQNQYRITPPHQHGKYEKEQSRKKSGRGGARLDGLDRTDQPPKTGLVGVEPLPTPSIRHAAETLHRNRAQVIHTQTATTTQLIGKSFRRRRKSHAPHILPIPTE